MDTETPALRILRIQANYGDARSQYLMGVECLSKKRPAATEEAIAWFKKSAEQGYRDGQLSLARLYSEGVGVVQDDVQAWAWGTIAGRPSSWRKKPEPADGGGHLVQSEALTDEESRLIRRWKLVYAALATGLRKPTTAAQQHFVDVCYHLAEPETAHEMALLKQVRMECPFDIDEHDQWKVPPNAVIGTTATPRASQRLGRALFWGNKEDHLTW